MQNINLKEVSTNITQGPTVLYTIYFTVTFRASSLYGLYKPTHPHWNVKVMNLINDIHVYYININTN